MLPQVSLIQTQMISFILLVSYTCRPYIMDHLKPIHQHITSFNCVNLHYEFALFLFYLGKPLASLCYTMHVGPAHTAWNQISPPPPPPTCCFYFLEKHFLGKNHLSELYLNTESQNDILSFVFFQQGNCCFDVFTSF